MAGSIFLAVVTICFACIFLNLLQQTIKVFCPKKKVIIQEKVLENTWKVIKKINPLNDKVEITFENIVNNWKLIVRLINGELICVAVEPSDYYNGVNLIFRFGPNPPITLSSKHSCYDDYLGTLFVDQLSFDLKLNDFLLHDKLLIASSNSPKEVREFNLDHFQELYAKSI